MSLNKKTTIKKILTYLEEVPIKHAACEKVGIARSTLYKWMDEDPELLEAIETALVKGREVLTDLAESKLFSEIQNVKQWAIVFYLTHNCPRYMKREKIMEMKSINPTVALVEFIGEKGDEDPDPISEPTYAPKWNDPI